MQDLVASSPVTMTGAPNPLHEACLAGNLVDVQHLLSKAASPAAARTLAEAADSEGRTPLMLAAAVLDEVTATSLLSCLLAVGASVSCQDVHGRSALHWACSKGAVQALLQAGARVDARDEIGDTPAHTACRYGHDGALLALLESSGEQGPTRLLAARNHAGGMPITVAGWQARSEGEEPSMDALARERALLCIMQYHPPSRVLVLHHPDCLLHENSETHQEAPQRVTAILEEIGREYGSAGQGAELLRLSSDFPRATGEQVSRAHSKAYWGLLQAVDSVVRHRGDALAGGLPLTPIVQRSLLDVPANLAKAGSATDTGFRVGTLQASLRAAGAVCRAVEDVLSGQARHALAVVRPPGHHAGINGLPAHSHSATGPGHASSCGFCILNNVAIGALHALTLPPSPGRTPCKRVAIIDLDAHHGNGTEEIVREWYRKQRSEGDSDASQSVLFFSVHLWDEERVPHAAPAPGPGPGPEGGEREGAEAMVSPPLGQARRPARARAGRQQQQPQGGAVGGAGEGNVAGEASGEGVVCGEGAGGEQHSLATASGTRARRPRSKSNAAEEGGNTASAAPSSKRSRPGTGSTPGRGVVPPATGGSTTGGSSRARKGSITSTTSTSLRATGGRKWTTTALSLPTSPTPVLHGWTVRGALYSTCVAVGVGGEWDGGSSAAHSMPSSSTSAFTALPPLLSHPALGAALLPPPGVSTSSEALPPMVPPLPSLAHVPLPLPLPTAAPFHTPQGERQEEKEEEDSEAEEAGSEGSPSPSPAPAAAPPSAPPKGSPMPPPPPPMVVQVSVDRQAPDAAASWRVEGEPVVGFHAGHAGWEGEGQAEHAQLPPPVAGPGTGAGRVQFELTMSHAGIGLTPMARSNSMGGAGGGAVGTPRVAGMARSYSGGGGVGAGGHGGGHSLARHGSYGGGIGASLLVAGAAAGSVASLGGSGGGPPLGTTPLSRSYSGGGAGGGGGSGTRRGAVVGLQISPDNHHASSSSSSASSSSSDSPTSSTPGPGMLDDIVPDGLPFGSQSTQPHGHAAAHTPAHRPLAPPRLTLARQPSEADAGSSAAWPSAHGPPTATALGALSPVGAVNALLARQGVKGGQGEGKRGKRGLWGQGKDGQQMADSDSETHAPGDLLWAFYPGTGAQDILQDNIINCPLLPLWKDGPGHGHGGKGGRHSHGGTAAQAGEEGGSKATDPPPRSGWKAVRHLITSRLLPALRAFSPDLILLSAGFDGCKDDYGNCKNDKVYAEGKRPQGLNLRPEDYAWITERIVEVSATCCPGRVVSVLEGGYGKVKWKRVQPVQAAAGQEGEGSGAGAAPQEPAGGGRMSTRGGGQGRPHILSPARGQEEAGTGEASTTTTSTVASAVEGGGAGPHGLSIDPHAPRHPSPPPPPPTTTVTWVMDLDREPLAKACCAMLGALVQEGGGGSMIA